MNIAYCIICHQFSKILEKTVEILHKDNDIYVHVDKKSNLNDFIKIRNKVIFIKKRINVNWGQFSQIEATIELLKETQKKNYDYIFLISGVCLPLKTSKKIKEFLQQKNGLQFVGCVKNKDVSPQLKYNYYKGHFKTKNQRTLFEKIILKIQNIFLRQNKFYKYLPPLYKGSNWFTITGDLRDYILTFLDKNLHYKKAFLHSKCGDEIFFQTIIYNSQYKNYIHESDLNIGDTAMSLRYIDWDSGPEFPKILNEEDFPKMAKSNCLFARKFNNDLDLDAYEKYFSLKNLQGKTE
ncbi:MAG: beta-1,6-N-acetylglucosaminyltransferase [Treponemataceae bacterium]